MGIMLTEYGRKSSPSEYAEKLGISRCGLWVKVLVVVTCPARFVYEKNAIFIFDISLIVDLLPLTLSPQNDISFPWLLSLLLTVASNVQPVRHSPKQKTPTFEPQPQTQSIPAETTTIPSSMASGHIDHAKKQSTTRAPSQCPSKTRSNTPCRSSQR